MFLHVKLGVFRRDDSKGFLTGTKFYNGRVRCHPIHAIEAIAENFGGEQVLSLIQILTMSEDINEQLKLAHWLMLCFIQTERNA